MTPASICGPTCGAPLFLHVLGATSLVGDVGTVALLSYIALRTPAHAVLLRRLAFATTLVGVWPSLIAMRIGAQWVAEREHLADADVSWIGVGYGVADGGVILVALLTFLAWLATRRPRAGTFVAAVALLYLAALGVAMFFMSAKP